MIGFATLLLTVGGGFVGRLLGPFRALNVAGAAFLAALAALNWGPAFADAVQGGSQATLGAVFLLTFVATMGVLVGVAVWLAPESPRAPWLLADAGGAAGGAVAGWLIAGVLVLAFRLQPAVNAAVENARGEQTAALGAPDDFLLREMESASQGGLQRRPAKPFDRRADFLQRREARD
jgi:hypothetical protein